MLEAGARAAEERGPAPILTTPILYGGTLYLGGIAAADRWLYCNRPGDRGVAVVASAYRESAQGRTTLRCE